MDIEDLRASMSGSNSSGVVEQVTYAIWGAIASTSKGFETVSMKVDSNVQFVFAEVKLRWWAKYDRMAAFRSYWLKKANRNAKEYLPVGWRLVVFYERNERDDSGDQGRVGAIAHDIDHGDAGRTERDLEEINAEPESNSGKKRFKRIKR